MVCYRESASEADGTAAIVLDRIVVGRFVILCNSFIGLTSRATVQVMSAEHWMRVLRILADAGEKTDRPWLRWLAHDSPLIAIRLLALEVLGNSLSDTHSKQSRAEGDRCLLTLINTLDVVSQEDSDASHAVWTRFT